MRYALFFMGVMISATAPEQRAVGVEKPEDGRDAVVRLSDEHVAAVRRRRRTVVNYDVGCHISPFTDPGVTPEQLVEYSFSFIDAGKHSIDSVWLCFFEGDLVVYPSKVQFPMRHPKYRKWLAEGVDLLRIYVDETRKRGLEAFYSMRMNGADPSANFLPTTDKFSKEKYQFLPLKKAHMDWLIRVWTVDPGQPDPRQREDCVWLWNYARPEVRAYKLSALRELAENYDLDGIELDFARLPPMLPLGHQWEHRQALTDFVRSVRLMTLEVERKRGRPLLLAVRVPDSVLGAKIDGMDLETWARLQLVDIMVPGPRAVEVDVAGFRRIIAGTPIKVYPCIDGYHSADGYEQPTIEVLRGLAANHFQQGADGLQTFNFCNLTRPFVAKIKMKAMLDAYSRRMDAQQQFYAELADPASLRQRDKTFVVGRRGGGFPEPWRFPNPEDWYTPKYSYCNTNMFAQLPADVSNCGKVDTLLRIAVGDDVNAEGPPIESIALRILLSDPAAEKLPPEERLPKALVRGARSRHEPYFNAPPEKGIENRTEVRLNGVVLDRAVVRDGWLAFDVKPVQLALGENLIGVRVGGRSADDPQKVRIEKAELDIKYRKQARE